MKILIFGIAIVIVIGFNFLQLKNSLIPENTTSKTAGSVISGTFDQNKFKTEAEWKKTLTPKQYHILQEAGTEIPFTGELDNKKRKGTYYSVGCDKPLFRSEQKYDSGTGWPSFWAPIDGNALVLREKMG